MEKFRALTVIWVLASLIGCTTAKNIGEVSTNNTNAMLTVGQEIVVVSSDDTEHGVEILTLEEESITGRSLIDGAVRRFRYSDIKEIKDENSSLSLLEIAGGTVVVVALAPLFVGLAVVQIVMSPGGELNFDP